MKQHFRSPFILIQLALSLIILAAGYMVLTDKAEPTHLVLKIKGDFTPNEKIEVFFRTNPLSVGSRKIELPEHINRLSYKLPEDFVPEMIRLDAGFSKITWSVKQVQLSAKYLFFNIEAYEWPIADFAQSVFPHPTVTINIENEEKLQITNLTTDSRVYFPYNLDSFKPNNELQFLRALLLGLCAGILLLIWNGFVRELLTTRKEDALQYRSTFDSIWQTKKSWILSGSLLLLIVNIIYYFPNLVNPGFSAEDTMEFSDTFQGHVDLLSFDTYHYYRGYKTILVRWFAALWSNFPISWQPALYVLTGFTTASLAALVISYSGLYKTRTILLIAPMVILACGSSHPILFLSLTSVLFSSVLILLGLLIAPAPKNKWLYGLLCLLIPILAWSGPYSSQVIPISVMLLLLLCTVRKQWLLVLALISTLAYISSASEGMLQLSNLADFEIQVDLYEAIIEHVFFISLVQNLDYKVGLLIICLVAGIFYYLRNDRTYIKHSLTLLCVSISAIAGFFLSAKYNLYKGEINPAHTHIAQFFWVAFVLLTLDRLIADKLQDKNIIAKAIIVIVCFFVSFYNLSSQPNLRIDKDLKGFLSAIKSVQTEGVEEGRFVQLWHRGPRNNITSVKLGSNSKTATTLKKQELSPEVRPYYSFNDINREPRTVEYYKGRGILLSSKSKKTYTRPLTNDVSK